MAKDKGEKCMIESKRMRRLILVEGPARSGSVNSDSKLVCFLYVLMQNELTPGKVESLIENIDNGRPYEFSNGWLARHAQDIARRLQRSE